jgi:hypothetical protein
MPTWYAPNAPPPWRTRTTCPGSALWARVDVADADRRLARARFFDALVLFVLFMTFLSSA